MIVIFGSGTSEKSPVLLPFDTTSLGLTWSENLQISCQPGDFNLSTVNKKRWKSINCLFFSKLPKFSDYSTFLKRWVLLTWTPSQTLSAALISLHVSRLLKSGGLFSTENTIFGWLSQDSPVLAYLLWRDTDWELARSSGSRKGGWKNNLMLHPQKQRHK